MRIFEWDGSLAVQLPAELIGRLSLLEGDELKIVDVIGRTLVVEKEDRRKAAIERIASHQWELPPDYKFDREEANER